MQCRGPGLLKRPAMPCDAMQITIDIHSAMRVQLMIIFDSTYSSVRVLQLGPNDIWIWSPLNLLGEKTTTTATITTTTAIMLVVAAAIPLLLLLLLLLLTLSWPGPASIAGFPRARSSTVLLPRAPVPSPQPTPQGGPCQPDWQPPTSPLRRRGGGGRGSSHHTLLQMGGGMVSNFISAARSRAQARKSQT